MKFLSLETAEAVAKRVNHQLKEWDIPISARPNFIILVALVVRELRAEARSQKPTSTDE